MVTRTTYSKLLTRDDESEKRIVVVQLPLSLQLERRIAFNTSAFPMYERVVDLLASATSLGFFNGDEKKLENYRVAGSLRQSHAALTAAVVAHEGFLDTYDALMRSVILEHTIRRHRASTLYYQFPPSVRIQPGPSEAAGRMHSDAEYGHRRGELNFWMPLTEFVLTQTALMIESEPGKADFRPIDLGYGELLSWYGTACRHFAPANSSSYTRVSLDFRVAIGASSSDCEDERLVGPLANHCRRYDVPLVTVSIPEVLR